MVKKEEKIKNHNILKLLIFIFIAMILYARFIETKGLVVKEYYITDKDLPDSFNGFKIVHFSDVHFGTTVDIKYLKSIVNKINSLNPNVVVFTGDLIDDSIKIKDEDKKKIISVLSSINVDVKKIAVKGNNDYVKKNSYEEIMSSSGFDILNNTYELIYYKGLVPIYVAGLPSSIKEKYDAKDSFIYYDTLIESDIKPEFKIVLIHEPDNINLIKNYDVNLVLAGHSHNGQIRIPFVGAVITPKGSKEYYDNYYKIGKTRLYISSGIGTSKIKFRFNNKPSINFYRLNSK